MVEAGLAGVSGCRWRAPSLSRRPPQRGCSSPCARRQRCAQRWPAAARRYAPDDWHLTLHFLGAVSRERLEDLCAGLAAPVAPFILHLGLPVSWPQGLAVLLPDEAPSLLHLYEQLGQAVRAQGLSTDTRPYRPHVTLARHAAAAEPPAQAAAFDWPVRGYALVESTGDAARRYRIVQAYGEVPT